MRFPTEDEVDALRDAIQTEINAIKAELAAIRAQQEPQP